MTLCLRAEFARKKHVFQRLPPPRRDPPSPGAAPRSLAFLHAMSLSLDDVRRIADLARIALSDDEAAGVHAKLASIFGLVDELFAIPTDGVEPMAHAQAIALPLRDDAVTERDERQAYQRVAPATDAGLYLVPKVIE
jgi:aspartyl-tRNA(Asn)/glutamyl-tRNA(Gln) amidotransferase subunit C